MSKSGLVKIGIHFWILIINPRFNVDVKIMYFSVLDLDTYTYILLLKLSINHKEPKSVELLYLVNSSAMQVLLVDKISAVFDPFLSGFLSVIRKEFEVPPYSQSVELGSQIQLRCHPPKGVPTPRVSVLK